jgi:Aerobic-type carbon monoxide dehydrogenase, large subunit CoxL/CutL homologs
VARLIRTEKEVEGRYEEIWLVVEEDALDQWPAGPLDVVGRPAARVDGFERARGEAIFTADLQLNGMLHTAVLRSPHPRALVKRIDLTPALGLPGVHAAIGPGDCERLTDDCNFQGAAIAAVCADTNAQARAALAAVDVEFDVLEPLLDAEEAVRRGQLLGEPRTRERGDAERGFAEADAVVEGEFRTQVVLHNSMETHQASCSGSATGSTSTSRRSTSGGSVTRSPPGSACRRTRCAWSATTWAAASARRTAPTTTRSSPPSWRSAPAAL